MLTAKTTEYETRALAGLAVNASIEEVDQTQGLKLDNNAQLMTIPGIDLTTLPAARRADALQKLNAASCTCGCDLTVAKCRVDDPACGVSLPLARQIVKQIAGPISNPGGPSGELRALWAALSQSKGGWYGTTYRVTSVPDRSIPLAVISSAC